MGLLIRMREHMDPLAAPELALEIERFGRGPALEHEIDRFPHHRSIVLRLHHPATDFHLFAAGQVGAAVTQHEAALQDLVANNVTESNLVRIGQGFGGVTDLEVGPDSHMYVVDINGRVLRIRGIFPVALQDFRVE